MIATLALIARVPFRQRQWVSSHHLDIRQCRRLFHQGSSVSIVKIQLGRLLSQMAFLGTRTGLKVLQKQFSLWILHRVALGSSPELSQEL